MSDSEKNGSRKRLLKIDLIKGIAILSVLLTHSLPYDGVFITLRMLSVSMALPIFILLMGRNMSFSFERHKYVRSNTISLEYFKNRFKRFLLPFIPIFVLSIILGLLLNREIYIGVLNLVGYLPLAGPGNYFVSVLFQFIIVFPLLYLSYRRYPRFTLIFTFFISLVFELIASTLNAFNSNSYVYYANILRYLFLITLGLWVLNNFEPLKRISSTKQFRIIVIGLLASLTYLVAFSIFHWEFPYFNQFWGSDYPTLGSYLFLISFYPLVLYMMAYKILPSSSDNKITKFIQLLGKASYHIFLVQILFFSLLYNPYSIVLRHKILFGATDPYIIGIGAVLISLVITITAGLIFYKFENKIESTLKI